MKGLFYKNNAGVAFEIISEPMAVRNELGYDDVMIAVKSISDGRVDVIPFFDIARVSG